MVLQRPFACLGYERFVALEVNLVVGFERGLRLLEFKGALAVKRHALSG